MYGMTLTQYQQVMNRLTSIRNELTTARQEHASETNLDMLEVHQLRITKLVNEMRKVGAEMNAQQNK